MADGTAPTVNWPPILLGCVAVGLGVVCAAEDVAGVAEVVACIAEREVCVTEPAARFAVASVLGEVVESSDPLFAGLPLDEDCGVPLAGTSVADVDPACERTAARDVGVPVFSPLKDAGPAGDCGAAAGAFVEFAALASNSTTPAGAADELVPGSAASGLPVVEVEAFVIGAAVEELTAGAVGSEVVLSADCELAPFELAVAELPAFFRLPEPVVLLVDAGAVVELVALLELSEILAGADDCVCGFGGAWLSEFAGAPARDRKKTPPL